MKTRTKKIIITVSVFIIIVVGLFFWSMIDAFHRFSVEDKIHGAFTPVAFAIDRFVQTNSIPPANLDQLVPIYLSSVPTSQYAYRIDYRVVDGTNWILNVHSKTLPTARVYSWRSDWTFTDNEKTNLLGEYHNIAVFKE